MLRLTFFTIIFLFPIIFQLIYGIKAIHGKIRMKFYQVCIIGLIGQIASAFINGLIMFKVIERSESKDALPMVGVYSLGIAFLTIMIVIVVLQTIIFYRKKKSLSPTNSNKTQAT